MNPTGSKQSPPSILLAKIDGPNLLLPVSSNKLMPIYIYPGSSMVKPFHIVILSLSLSLSLPTTEYPVSSSSSRDLDHFQPSNDDDDELSLRECANPNNPPLLFDRSWKGKRKKVAVFPPLPTSSLAVVARTAGGFLVKAFRAGRMSYGSSSIATGVKSSPKVFEYGRSHVVRPKGKHLATVVWLHGLGDNGASWCQLLETLPLPNIKWICPTAPTRPVAVFGGFPSTAWFNVTDLSEDGSDDIEGLDASAAHVANLLSAEPTEVKLGLGGFSMGAATALYSASCCAHGKYGNGKPYPVKLSAVVALSGWLPCAKSLKDKLEESQLTARRAASLPLLLCHGKADEVVLYKHGENSAEALKSAGFQLLKFNSYNSLGHYTVPEEMDDVGKWLMEKLELDGSLF